MALQPRQIIVLALPLVLLTGLGWLTMQGGPEAPASSGPAASSPQAGGRWEPLELPRGDTAASLEGWDVRRGAFRVSLLPEQNLRLLELLPEPIVEGKMLRPRALRGGGGIRIRTRGERSRRSFPRFSVGLHQSREFHLRALPGESRIELVSCLPDLTDEVLHASASLTGWSSPPEEWIYLELMIRPADPQPVSGPDTLFLCEGRLWPEGQERPATAQLVHRLPLTEAVFHAAVQGAAFALRPIQISGISVYTP